MTSPGCTPARSAGPAGCTLDTMKPPPADSLKPMPMPSTGPCTAPVAPPPRTTRATTLTHWGGADDGPASRRSLRWRLMSTAVPLGPSRSERSMPRLEGRRPSMPTSRSPLRTPAMSAGPPLLTLLIQNPLPSATETPAPMPYRPSTDPSGPTCFVSEAEDRDTMDWGFCTPKSGPAHRAGQWARTALAHHCRGLRSGRALCARRD